MIVCSFILAVMLLASAYAGLVTPTGGWLSTAAAILCVTFQWIAAVCLCWAIVCLAARRWKAMAVMTLAICLAWPTVSSHMPLHLTDTDAPPQPLFTVATMNVRNYNCSDTTGLKEQPSASLRLLLDTDADVILTQETFAYGWDYERFFAVRPLLAELRQRYPYRSVDRQGITIFSKHPFTATPVGPVEDTYDVAHHDRGWMHHYAMAYDLTLPDGQRLRVINVHLRSFGLATLHAGNAWQGLARAFALRAEQARQVRQAVDSGPRTVVVAGDFNDVPTSYTLRTVMGGDLGDSWQQCAAWPVATLHKPWIHHRIDYVLYRGDLSPVASQVPAGGSSDHRAVVTTFALGRK